MHILLLGSGGREHAMAWRISQSPLCTRLFIAPGNAGTMECGTNLSLDPVDFPAIRQCCITENIGMVVVGPEEPLVRGIYDFFRADPALAHIPVIGHSGTAAKIEGSKSLANAYMSLHGIPTEGYREFDDTN